jgi:hypothetical protein
MLLIGGAKTGNTAGMFVPMADHLYDDHLEGLKEEGLSEYSPEEFPGTRTQNVPREHGPEQCLMDIRTRGRRTVPRARRLKS